MNKRWKCFDLLVSTILFSLMLTLSPQVIAQTDKGIELFNSGKYHNAEGALREALKSNPSDATANYYLGLSVLLQNRYKEAFDIFSKVKDAQSKADQRSRSSVPSAFQIQIALARAQLGLKQYDEAWKHLESARTQNPSSSEVYLYRGIYYLQQEKTSEAINELEKAISLDAKNAYAYYFAGVANYRGGHSERAVELLKIFLKLKPDAPEATDAKWIIDQLC
jgi:tetratricopeptide (TPR) repeat protein